MEWPEGFILSPHEHHNRPCFELLLEGRMHVCEYKSEKIKNNIYRLEIYNFHSLKPGDIAKVDLDVQIHSIYSSKLCRSLHVYPKDNDFTYFYNNLGNDNYKRTKLKLG